MSNHVVTVPTSPFKSASGRIEVHQVPSGQDNLSWIVVCCETGAAMVVDGPEADPVLQYCAAMNLDLQGILNTHTHMDHVGINHGIEGTAAAEGMRVYGPARAARDVPLLTDPVDQGDEVMVGAAVGCVMLTEGHINGHVSYVFDDILFCGDTMFGAGCGYLFDGPAETMHLSLERLAALDAGTRVCCAHEYTQDNLRFAWSVEPDNQALKKRIADTWAIRGRGGCSVPSTIAVERETNPFVRSESETLRASLRAAFPGRSLDRSADVFAATRALKDRKDYRRITDEELPINS